MSVSDDRTRLISAIRARRVALGLSVQSAAGIAGVARNTWIGLESGRTRPQQRHYAGIERALQWAPGSLAAIETGGEPVADERPAVAPTRSRDLDAEIARIKALPFPVETRLAMLTALIDLHAEAAAEEAARSNARSDTSRRTVG